MRVNFYLAGYNLIAKKHAFKNIDSSKNAIILTPDRNTMNIEKELLNVLNKKSIFNVNVTTFARLSRNYLTEKKLFKNVLTKHASVALIKKLMLENKNNLKLFKNNIEKDGFAEKIFEAISLYRSCGIMPEDFFVPSNNTILQYKLEDVFLIYQKYEKFLQEDFIDSFNQLDLFEKNLDNESFKNTDFYLVDFEDVTPVMVRVLTKLAKVAGSVNICTTYSKANKGANNEYIYINDIFYNLNSSFEASGIKANKIYVEGDNLNSAILSKNIFSSKVIKDVSVLKPSLNLLKANNIKDEVLSVVSKIKRMVLDGQVKLSDIELVVADLQSYKVQLEETLQKAEISYYIDQSETLADNILCKIILLILDLACKGVINKYTILQLVDTGILNLSLVEVCEYKKYIKKIDAKGCYLYTLPDKLEASEDLSSAINKINEFVKLLNLDHTTVLGYMDLVDNIKLFLKFDEYYEMLYAKFVNVNDIVNAKKLSQAYTKLAKVWDELVMVFKNTIIEKSEFVSIFKTFVEDINLSLAPIKVNSLVVSDFENSFISENKIIFVMGASDSVLPKYNIETALLSDSDINNLKEKNRLTPTINLINKRKKFKLFELCLKANVGIYFSYVCVDSKGEEVYPTMAYSELNKYLTNSCIEEVSEDLIAVNDSDVLNKLITNNITPKFAVDNIVNYLKQWNLYNNLKEFRQNLTSLYHSVADYSKFDLIANANYENICDKITNSNKLFFKSKEVSPSEFESFANCPYSHFLTYGLRLNEEEVAKVGINDIGNIIHDYMKNIIYDLNNYKNDSEFLQNINTFIKNNLDKVLSSKKYYRFIASSVNKNTVKSLQNEVVRITNAILEQLQLSDYEPTYLEYDFSKNKTGCLVIKLKSGKNIELTGKIDRVDVNKSDNTFFIIDYKTGNPSFSDYSDLVTGRKIQLFAYLLMFKNYSKKTPVGAFYLPIGNKPEENKKYKYKGFFVNNLDVLGNIDHTLRVCPSSSVTLNATLKADGKFYNTGNISNLAISEGLINNALEYLIKNLTLNAESIEGGYIDIVPLWVGKEQKTACTYCKYKGICNFNTKYKNKYRRVEKVASLDQLGFGEKKEEVENV